MDTKMIEQFHEMDITMLSSIEGGKNNWQTNVLEGGGGNWGDFAKAGIGGGAARGLQLGIKTGTWQGAAGGAILGGVAYAVTCWW